MRAHNQSTMIRRGEERIRRRRLKEAEGEGDGCGRRRRRRKGSEELVSVSNTGGGSDVERRWRQRWWTAAGEGDDVGVERRWRQRRQQVAYVLGQLQNKAAASALSEILRNVNEHPMVRHEAAEALGSIADGESVALLNEFAKDPEPIVSQSCEVALSMLEFERSGKMFEYLFMQTPQVQ